MRVNSNAKSAYRALARTLSGSASGQVMKNHTSLEEERSARCDLATSEGRKAYERFHQTLEISGRGSPGVSDVTRPEEHLRSQTRSAGGQVGGSVAALGDTAAGEVTTMMQREDVTVSQPDRAVERQYTTQRAGFPTVRQASLNDEPPVSSQHS